MTSRKSRTMNSFLYSKLSSGACIAYLVFKNHERLWALDEALVEQIKDLIIVDFEIGALDDEYPVLDLLSPSDLGE